MLKEWRFSSGSCLAPKKHRVVVAVDVLYSVVEIQYECYAVQLIGSLL